MKMSIKENILINGLQFGIVQFKNISILLMWGQTFQCTTNLHDRFKKNVRMDFLHNIVYNKDLHFTLVYIFIRLTKKKLH